MSKEHRILRVLEYVGTEEFIRDSINKRSVKGCHTIGKQCAEYRGVIREAILGETSEVLSPSGDVPVSDIVTISKQTIQDLATEYEFEKWWNQYSTENRLDPDTRMINFAEEVRNATLEEVLKCL